MKKNEVIKKDTQNNYYVYQIEFKGHVQTGFLSLAKISDFLNENIKAHEKIYENRKLYKEYISRSVENLKDI